jgi:predicted MPP superfamily phosphohydrolase
MAGRDRDDSDEAAALGPQGRDRGPQLLRYTVEVPGLDPAHDGLRIAHLSDLHVGILTPHRFIRAAIDLARAERPDLVVMTGDFVCYSPRYVGDLDEVIRGIEVPTLCVMGNHDYWTDGHGVMDVFAHRGYDVLRNQHTRLTLRGAPLTVIGIDDAVTGQADVARAFRGIHAHDSRIILSHVPSLFDPIAARGPGLVLSGHTHGGHIQIPKLTARLFRSLGSPYVKGFYRAADAVLYVSCGIGSSSIPIRAGAPSEVAILTLRTAPLTS